MQQRLADIPVAVLSASPDVDELAAAMGAAGYLRKPTEHNELLAMEERHCQLAHHGRAPRALMGSGAPC